MSVFGMLVTFILLLVGLALISSSMTRHSGLLGIHGSTGTRGRWLKIGGYALLLISIPLVIRAAGVGYGLTWWFALLTIAHFVISLALTYASETTPKGKRSSNC